MGNTPSIFEPTPQEHAARVAALLESKRRTVVWPPRETLPPGHVCVQFYFFRHRLRDGCRPDIESAVPLSASGELNLWDVRRMWGLETCSVIDPDNMKLGFPVDANILPADIVPRLVERNGYIKLIEPHASYSTLLIRHVRHIVVPLTSMLFSLSASLIAHTHSTAEKHRPTLRRLRSSLSSSSNYRFYLADGRHIDWLRVALLLSILLACFIVFVWVMHIDLGVLREVDHFCKTIESSPGLGFVLVYTLAKSFLEAPERYGATLEERSGGAVQPLLVLSAF